MPRPRARSLVRRSLLLALVASAVVVMGVSRGAGREVVLLRATGIVDNVMAAYIAEGIAGAERDGAAAVVIELDTPGGSLGAMQQIVEALGSARVPTIVWVAPSGAWAASAGTFITLAAHVALMAPGTNIGAASPVDSSGQDITGTEGTKVKNTAIAYIKSIAEKRGRNVDWAVQTVDVARSSPASEAVALGAVDGIAATIDDVLRVANGRQVDVAGSAVTLDLAGATVTEAGMNPFQGFLHLLSDPNIAFIMFTLGFYGLLAEIWHPNFVTGIIGALAIILAFIGFGSLPLNVAGLLLIGLAIVLFALEATVPSHGLLVVGGIVCFALGASALYTTPGNPAEPIVRVALPLIVTMSAMTAGFMALISFVALRSRRMAAPAGSFIVRLPAGTKGEVRRPLDPTGSIYAAGEEWSARTSDGRSLSRGTPVRVISTDGLTIVVEPDPSSSSST